MISPNIEFVWIIKIFLDIIFFGQNAHYKIITYQLFLVPFWHCILHVYSGIFYIGMEWAEPSGLAI